VSITIDCPHQQTYGVVSLTGAGHFREERGSACLLTDLFGNGWRLLTA